MTLLSKVTRVAYQADGATRIFPVPFRIWSPHELLVVLRPAGSTDDQILSLGDDYACNPGAAPGEGSIALASAPPTGTRVVIERRAELVQELDLVASGAFSAGMIEDQFDRLTAQMQAIASQLERVPSLPVGSATATPTLPEPLPGRAGQLIGISADGNRYECRAPAALGLQVVSSFAAKLLDDPDAAAARATLGIAAQVELGQLATDTTGGAPDDQLAFTDASRAHAAGRVPVPAFLANAVGGLQAAPATQDRELLARNPATGAAERVAAGLVGAGRQTIWIPAAALQPRLSAGAAPATVEVPANRLALRTLDFDPVAPEHAQLVLQMPRSWNRGPLTAVLVWAHGPATAAFGVVWGLRVAAMGDAGPLDAAFGASVMVTDTGGAANTLYRTGETAGLVPATQPGETSVLALEVFRAAADPADTLATDARLIGITLHYVTVTNTDA